MTDSETLPQIEERISSVLASIDRLRDAVARSFLGHKDVVDLAILSILADGHCLLEVVIQVAVQVAEAGVRLGQDEASIHEVILVERPRPTPRPPARRVGCHWPPPRS